MDGVQLPQGYNENHLEEAVYFLPLREHRQKTFVTLSRFWLLMGWLRVGGEVLVNLLKKENS